MRKTIPAIAATILLAAMMVISCLLAGCAEAKGRSDDGLSLSLNGAAISLPEGFEKVDPSSFVEVPYEDGTVTAQMVRAKNTALPASVSLSRVEGRDFDAIQDWALRLPESASDWASATSFGLLDDFRSFMPLAFNDPASTDDIASAKWDNPVFFSTSLGESVRVSYVIGTTRTTALYVNLGAGMYVEVWGAFPEAAYAHDPGYFDGIFSDVYEYRESVAVNSLSNLWTLIALLFFPVCLVATLAIVLLKKPIRNFIGGRPALEERYQRIKAAGPKEGWSGYVLAAVVMLFLFGGAALIFIGAS